MELEIQSSPANAGTSVSAQPDPLLGALGGGNASPIPAASVQQVVAPPVIDTSKLKALLITLGHDVEAEWDHLIALAKKAL